MVLDTNLTMCTNQQAVLNRTKQRTVARVTITFLDLKTGGTGKLNWMPKLAQKLLAQVVAFLVLLFLTLSRVYEWPSGSVRFFYEGSPNSWKWITRFGLKFCYGLNSL